MMKNLCQKTSDKPSSERENQLVKYFGPLNSGSVREDHTFTNVGSLDIEP
jgi:hypothetical protein